MKKEIVRYAPSPTGKLHIGGARTALFNYLYSKNNNGIFIIRTEDTDIARNINDGEKNQIDNLQWLGIVSDENALNPGQRGPYRQSERIDIYNNYIAELIEKGIAYKCYCTKEELEEERKDQESRGISSPKYSGKCRNRKDYPENTPYVVRVKMPKDVNYSWIDGVRGEITVNSDDVGDWVIVKSNGIPTYNFANVIDDHLMEITHVIRGEEHITNTPKQLHLYEQFGWEPPKYTHPTIIIGENNKKLSKRDLETKQFIEDYRKMGILPEAIFNYLAFLGWSPKNESEIYSKEELIKLFSIKGLSKSPSKYDFKKLLWYNEQYIKLKDKKFLYNELKKYLDDSSKYDKNIEGIFDILIPQLQYFQQINSLISPFNKKINYSIPTKNNEYLNEHNELLTIFYEKIQNIKWDYELINDEIKSIGKKLNVKGKDLLMPIRIAISGVEHGPQLKLLIFYLGREIILNRLEKVLN